MVIIKNKILEVLIVDMYQKEGLEIDSCIINKIVVAGCNFTGIVKISNCVIVSFDATSTWFEGGLVIENSILLQLAKFEAGGHNKESNPVIMNYNIFNCFVDFFDCQYIGRFIFKNNIVSMGSNLLSNLDKSWRVLFQSGSDITNNIGVLNVKDEDLPPLS